MIKKYIFILILLAPLTIFAQKKGSTTIILDHTDAKITDITELLYYNKYDYTVEGNVVTTRPKVLPKNLGIYCVKFIINNGQIQSSSYFIPQNAAKDPNAPWGIGKWTGKVQHIYKATYLFGMSLMEIMQKNSGGQLGYK